MESFVYGIVTYLSGHLSLLPSSRKSKRQKSKVPPSPQSKPIWRLTCTPYRTYLDTFSKYQNNITASSYASATPSAFISVYTHQMQFHRFQWIELTNGFMRFSIFQSNSKWFFTFLSIIQLRGAVCQYSAVSKELVQEIVSMKHGSRIPRELFE